MTIWKSNLYRHGFEDPIRTIVSTAGLILYERNFASNLMGASVQRRKLYTENKIKATTMGGDIPIKTTTFLLSSSSPSCIKVQFNRYNEVEYSKDISECSMKWKDAIALVRISNHSTNEKFNRRTAGTGLMTSPSRKDICDKNQPTNEDSNNEARKDKSFSSYLPISIGRNFSKSFDWALETTAMQSCKCPFEYYCLPFNTQMPSKETEIARRSQVHAGQNDDGKIQKFSVAGCKDDNGKGGKNALRPYVPLRLAPFCEYCGSPSVRNCQNFDPTCQRPRTFFPKAEPPFCRRIMSEPL